VIYNFAITDPYNPPAQGLIVQGHDGNLHTTSKFGPYPDTGAVFTVSPSGALTTNFDFSDTGTQGDYPLSGLTLGTDGNYYGTTRSAGTNGGGTIFKITSGGTLTTLYNFGTIKYPLVEGFYPDSPPVQGRDGNYYGTTPNSMMESMMASPTKLPRRASTRCFINLSLQPAPTDTTLWLL
jgi:uncharacterized repeat protein (TIGR03803 family)